MNKYTTSQGHNFSTAAWLDLHFDASKTEYENIVKSIGIKAGSKVLDAGCGNGRFLNVLSEVISPSGEIVCMDLAQENIDAVNNYLTSVSLQTPVSTSVGNVTSLKFQDNSFDAIWCANVTQYLDEEDLNKAVNEFKRVLRPGGVLAIKETDGISYFFYPTKNIGLLWDSVHLMDQFGIKRWFIHPLEMGPLLRSHGFGKIKQSTFLVERRYPLDKMTQVYLEKLFEIEDVCWSDINKQTPDNQKEWQEISNKKSPNYILSNPNFYWREGHVLAIGIK